MGLNLDVDGYTKTLNNWKILWNMQKKLLKTKSILKLMYKLSGGPSFTFTVACSGDNSSLRQQQIDPNIVRISNDNLQVLRRFASCESDRPNKASNGYSPMEMCKHAGTYTSSGKKFWRYLPLTRSFLVCHQKIYFSLLHSIGIQLVPVEFCLRPHQWC